MVKKNLGKLDFGGSSSQNMAQPTLQMAQPTLQRC